MNIRDFKKKYELDLIPVSNETIILSNLVWDPLIGAPEFSHSGMPQNIFQAFLDAELIDEAKTLSWIQACTDSPFVTGELANINIDVDIDTAAAVNTPYVKFTNTFKFSKINKFEFGDIKAKVIPFSARVEIDALLEQMRAKKWKTYDGKLRRLFLIKELYYGSSIRITIDKKFDDEFSVSLQTYNIDAKLKAEGSVTKTYEFTNSTVPFAMRTSKVKDYNG